MSGRLLRMVPRMFCNISKCRTTQFKRCGILVIAIVTLYLFVSHITERYGTPVHVDNWNDRLLDIRHKYPEFGHRLLSYTDKYTDVGVSLLERSDEFTNRPSGLLKSHATVNSKCI